MDEALKEDMHTDTTEKNSDSSKHCEAQHKTYISVHMVKFILIRSNKMQQYAGIYLLQNHSTCFGCLSHLSSRVHKTVTAASGTGHSI